MLVFIEYSNHIYIEHKIEGHILANQKKSFLQKIIIFFFNKIRSKSYAGQSYDLKNYPQNRTLVFPFDLVKKLTE